MPDHRTPGPDDPSPSPAPPADRTVCRCGHPDRFHFERRHCEADTRTNACTCERFTPIAPPVVPYVPRSARPRQGEVRWSRCSSCRRSFVAAALVAGECQSCAGLQPLPLRGEGGRFLPGLTHGPAPSPSRPAGSVQSSRRAGGSR